jgi:ferric-dicitrate binding protein FerR (iron transport regulator)
LEKNTSNPFLLVHLFNKIDLTRESNLKTFFIITAVLFSILTHSRSRLIYAKGEVFVNDKKISKVVTLEQSDQIRTGEGALAIVSLADGSKMKLNENSSLTIRIGSKNVSSIHMDKGSAFFHVLKKNLVRNNKPTFKVKYKTVAMGVRGTRFFVSDGKGSAEDIWMCVNEGKVVIKSKMEKKSTTVKAGEGVVVKDASKTSEPRPLAWTKKLNWNMNPKKGKLVNQVSIEEAYNDLLKHDYD